MMNLLNVDALTNHLLRPTRFTYSITDLGSCIFHHNNTIYQRLDFTVVNPDNIKIQTSLWRKKQIIGQKARQQKGRIQNILGQKKEQHNTKIFVNGNGSGNEKHQNNESNESNGVQKNGNVMIYLHCNCGSRVQAVQLVYKALELGYVFVAYDSRACGHSQGQYISLGYHQIWDLESVITHLHDHYVSNPQIVLWGRSMGAVTAMNYLMNSTRFLKNIKVAVLDSPFINLNEVICEIVNKKIGVPKLLIDMFLSYIEPVIQQRVGFKISEFNLRGEIGKIQCPLILMASKSDGLIPFKHLEEIYDSHHGRKSIFYLNQSHTDQRSTQTVSKIFKAINRYFTVQKKNSQIQVIPKSPKVSKPLRSDLLSCRSSQLVNPSTAKKSIKKIELTYPYSSGKPEAYYTQLSIQKTKSLLTEQKKKKLSLNHCKSVKQQKGQPYSSIKTAIYLYSRGNECKQKMGEKMNTYDKKEGKYTANLLLNRGNQYSGSHRRFISNFDQESEMDKQNFYQKRLRLHQGTKTEQQKQWKCS